MPRWTLSWRGSISVTRWQVPELHEATRAAFMLGILTGFGAATLVWVFASDALHPRNNKQYTPPLNDEAPVVAHPPLNLLEGPTDDN